MLEIAPYSIAIIIAVIIPTPSPSAAIISNVNVTNRNAIKTRCNE
jgi:hypothetical protein